MSDENIPDYRKLADKYGVQIPVTDDWQRVYVAILNDHFVLGVYSSQRRADLSLRANGGTGHAKEFTLDVTASTPAEFRRDAPTEVPVIQVHDVTPLEKPPADNIVGTCLYGGTSHVVTQTTEDLESENARLRDEILALRGINRAFINANKILVDCLSGVAPDWVKK